MSGFVYFIGCECGTEKRVKIGYTGGSPSARCKALQVGSPFKLRVIAITPGTEKLEAQLHKTFAPLRLHGEWFSMALKLEQFIEYISVFEFGRPANKQTFANGIKQIIVDHERCYWGEITAEYIASANNSIWKAKRT